MRTLPLLLLCILSINCLAQDKQIIELNQAIDQAVVTKDFTFLNLHYADDFVFTHGTGTIDSKTSWLANLQKQDQIFLSRIHDSVTVEPHANLYIVIGTLTVSRAANPSPKKYGLRYLRVYSFNKKRWQLISHRTTSEWHFN